MAKNKIGSQKNCQKNSGSVIQNWLLGSNEQTLNDEHPLILLMADYINLKPYDFVTALI